MPEELKMLVEYGGIGLGAFSMYLLYKLSSNHLSHNTSMLQKLSDSIEKLCDLIEKKL